MVHHVDFMGNPIGSWMRTGAPWLRETSISDMQRSLPLEGEFFSARGISWPQNLLGLPSENFQHGNGKIFTNMKAATGSDGS
jgi:hypothetical protein